eukprot:TRINITY_DN4831_c0_g1_i1.p2 TRINITY_DN4831_c0_g1~~TRINITY_DN4831_c0_g1_i1.p2  ORF type:complete len:74 (+),score=29.87 TRINITY_DN4831_c0_g1_i1:188-409(+)
MQWVHWGDIRVIPYVAHGSLEESKWYEDEQPFDPDYFLSLSKSHKNEIRRKGKKRKKYRLRGRSSETAKAHRG